MANLLFSSGFEGGVALAAPSNGWQDITGTDSATGQSWAAPVLGGDLAIQLLAGGGAISDGIETMAGHDGAATRALHLNVTRTDDVTQTPLLLQPKASPADLYISEWVKLPADLGARLGPGGWMALNPAWKTAGDFRIGGAIEVGGDGTPHWAMSWDNNANGGLPAQTFWKGNNASVPVPLGQWFHVEFFSHRGDTDGRAWLKVNDATVFDHTGDNIGVNAAPIDRVFLGTAYGSAPTESWVDDIQIWDGVPTAPAPQPAPTPAPSPAPAPAPVSVAVGAGSDTLVLKISQDAWQGSAQYTVSVDGKQVGGTLTASASHAAGQSDTVTVKGDWAPGSHQASVAFLNDAWGGTADTDRNLYVDGATYDGAAVSGAKLALPSAGSAGFAVQDATALPGAPAANAVNGTAGNDTLTGTAGADVITGGPGNDKLTGGGGADAFVFQKTDGWDWIADFARGTDTLKMVGMARSDVSWHAATWNGVGSGVEVDYTGANGGVFLLGVKSLAWSDFVFA